MYKVIKSFTDLQDNGHAYNVGDIFPRLSVEAAEERLSELASENNLQGVPLIALVEEKRAASKKGKKNAAEE